VAGVFNLTPTNQKEMQYKNETYAEILLPCFDHCDGVYLDGYTEEDNIFLKITHSRSHESPSPFKGIKFTSEDIVPEDSNTETETEKELSLKAERTYQNIIAVLLEYIKGDITGIKPHPSYSSEAELIKIIESEYTKKLEDKYTGLSKRSLENKFATAKKSLSQYNIRSPVKT
jgi:hypothetical protein